MFRKLYLTGLLFFISGAPSFVLAQGYFSKIGLTLNEPFDGLDLMDVIATIIQIAFALAGLVATFYLIMGGYNYITSGGDPEAAEGAKVMITNAIIGMVVILVSYLIVDFILVQLQVTNNINLPNP
jgi:glucan phosphoethanolaminetransferase (alkaline phosphatase superfamily)